MKNLLFLILLFSTSLSFGQQSCNCNLALNNLIAKIESDYLGFKEKTQDMRKYNDLKNELLSESKISGDSSCMKIRERYTGFFKDFHVWILPKDTIPTIKNKNEAIRNSIFDINIKKFMGNASKIKEGIEGVWKSDRYEIGLKK